MTAELRSTIILATLQALDAAHPRALRAADLLIPLNHSGLASLTEHELSGLLADIQGLGLVASATDRLNAEITRWTRTEAGRVELRRSNL